MSFDRSTGVSLLTDLYQITMAYGYWKNGLDRREGVFHATFRSNPFGAGYTIAAGLGLVVDHLRDFRFTEDEIAWLATLNGGTKGPLFEREFLEVLRGLRLECDVDAIPEGTVVFPNEPLVRVRGPLMQAQLVETALLNLVNFQSLIATKASRVVIAAQGDPVIEFGLRRAQGPDGGVSASRASFVGGCAATSNVLAGKLYGIPVRGTHAHSWVMAFESEIEAFEAFAKALPDNCIFLVDTYDTLQGVRNAVEVGRRLRERGSEMVGIRLDSGDLAYLSIEARKILDESGFPDAKILASNDLDEWIITSLKQQGAKIDLWGVGTRLATAYDQPALGGVYKLAALRNDLGSWEYRIKLSEQTAKISVPGVLQVRRFRRNGADLGDMIFDELAPPDPAERLIIDPLDPTRQKRFDESATWEDLLVPIFRGGELVYRVPPLEESRERTLGELDSLHPTTRRFVNPHVYPVGLARNLHELRTRLVLEARGVAR
ncbi:MAG TPA: nicotinate phosphoribosyltransferase [Thermoanaerobaculia bacterium]|nr:nicotinate phosphoribosyltransferase [Thermoanaerobaculia bacterium]